MTATKPPTAADACPVCRLPLHPGLGYRIPRHRDSTGKWCPTSGLEYRIIDNHQP